MTYFLLACAIRQWQFEGAPSNCCKEIAQTMSPTCSEPNGGVLRGGWPPQSVEKKLKFVLKMGQIERNLAS